MRESGMTPMEVLVAGTMDNARFFRAGSRIGSIEPGKLADLISIESDVLSNISAARRAQRVMLNGMDTIAAPILMVLDRGRSWPIRERASGNRRPAEDPSTVLQ